MEDNATLEKKFRDQLVSASRALQKAKSQLDYLKNKDQEAIAVIGLSCRFPGARNQAEFWSILEKGRSEISIIPATRWDYREDLDESGMLLNKNYCKYGGFIDGVDEFDPLFFNISPSEAKTMDPQQRLFLQEAWSAVEDAGYSQEDMAGSQCGVFVGVMNQDYQTLLNKVADRVNKASELTGNSNSILAARISYFLDLKGPSLSIDTACSSSLVALSLACNSLRRGECDTALAGGVTLHLDKDRYILMSQSGMLAKDGRCKTFDDKADGFVPGEGVGVLLLKRLVNAIADNDHIYGVIKAEGINQDGTSNGITAPNSLSQISLISSVYERANIDPLSIGLVEAHGTGTPLGDPIEVDALTTIFNRHTDKKQFCAIGSIKTNIGHTVAAAGVAGVIKVLLSLKHQKIPASLNFGNANSHINFDNSPFYVNTKLASWHVKNGDVRRAAVSSFGFSGTNSHVVLEEFTANAMENSADSHKRDCYVMPVSAKTLSGLRLYSFQLRRLLEDSNDVSLDKMSFTLQIGRQMMEQRVVVCGNDRSNLIELMKRVEQLEDNDERLLSSLDVSCASDQATELLTAAREWLDGKRVNWRDFYGEKIPSRISLPTYPFSQERYWFKQSSNANTEVTNSSVDLSINYGSLSIIGAYDSNKRYKLELTVENGFVKDHCIGNEVIIAGVLYLDVIRKIYNEQKNNISTGKALQITDVFWSSPGNVFQPTFLVFTFAEGEKNSTFVKVCNERNASASLCKVKIREIDYPQLSFEVDAWQPKKNCSTINGVDVYKQLRQRGLNYGESYQCIDKVEFSNEYLLAKLKLTLACPLGSFDSALQACAFLLLQNASFSPDGTTPTPFSIDKMVIFDDCQNLIWVSVTLVKASDKAATFDIKIGGDNGKVSVVINGFSIVNSTSESKIDGLENDKLLAETLGYLKIQLAEHIDLDPKNIDSKAPLERYGIDSVMAISMTKTLEKDFGELSKTLFFEYQSIEELAEYFVEAHQTQLLNILGNAVTLSRHRDGNVGSSDISSIHNFTASALDNNSYDEEMNKNGDIAIIGLSGRYPMADNVNALWENLKSGKDCITEIPFSRWNADSYYSADKNEAGKCYAKWGGFIEGVDEFDPRFFNISPLEAEYLDPQERLFLQSAYSTMEDAGYTRDALSDRGRVGVFVGAMYSEYQLYGQTDFRTGKGLALSGSLAAIANRVSYTLGLTGPSMTVDSMCSSSLTAIHLACQSIIRGECDAAFAGGVNITIHPNKFHLLSQGRFASTVGRCKSFGQGGDGYVPGEGVGSVLLKSLAQAQTDGDHIYGVIKASSINHGGKTNGFTVPHPHAQAEVVRQALKRADIDPKTISYVEAHGTGTALGDPIEIAGLAKAFDWSESAGFQCGIGSLKSNIGHCEGAAGVAGLTKILLQMKHCQLAPSLHSENLNSNINFAKTPFYVQRELMPWQRPVFTLGHDTVTHPRRAGLSSFGAGGSNAHLIIEEYQNNRHPRDTTTEAVLIILSARTPEQLQQRCKGLLSDVKTVADEQLLDLAFTLQTGREPMKIRMGFKAYSIRELSDILNRYLTGHGSISGVADNISQKTSAHITSEDATHEALENKNYDALLQAWVNGNDVAWRELYSHASMKRLSLTTYPFAKERYWGVPDNQQQAPVFDAINPYLHRNISNFTSQRYTSSFSRMDSFIYDHSVQGRLFLPGSVFVNMSFSALHDALGDDDKEKKISLTKINWLSPVIIDEGNADVVLTLSPMTDGSVSAELSDSNLEGPIVYCRAILHVSNPEVSPLKDIQSEIVNYRKSNLEKNHIYDNFSTMRLQYGESFKLIDSFYVDDSYRSRLWAKIDASKLLVDNNPIHLHPNIIDAAFQCCALYDFEFDDPSPQAFVPFSVDKIESLGVLRSTMWVHVNQRENNASQKVFDIDIFDSDGEICVTIRGFFVKKIIDQNVVNPVNLSSELLLFNSYWQQQTAEQVSQADLLKKLALIYNPEEIKQETLADIKHKLSGLEIFLLPVSNENVHPYESAVENLYGSIQSVFHSKPKGEFLFQCVVIGSKYFHGFEGLSGLLLTAQREKPNLKAQLLLLEDKTDAESIIEIVRINASHRDEIVRYRDNTREVLRWNLESTANPVSVNLPWRDKGVYLITGGGGGLGLIFAEEICRQADSPVVILTGRSMLSHFNREKIESMTRLGATIDYLSADVTDKNQVQTLIKEIRVRYGNLNGIIHSAGVIRDSFIYNKALEDISSVVATKARGITYLDECSSDMPLDIFVAFSSIAGAVGNAGQSDYAAANAYMDYYIANRQQLVSAGRRSGISISINWSLWRSGGMQLNSAEEDELFRTKGIVPMDSSDGIRAFYHVVEQVNKARSLNIVDSQRRLVLYGERVKMMEQLFRVVPGQSTGVIINSEVGNRSEVYVNPVPNVNLIAVQKIEAMIVDIVSAQIKIPVNDIDLDSPWGDFGYESISLTAFANLLNTAFKLDITPPIFYEYSSIHALASWIAENRLTPMVSTIVTQSSAQDLINDPSIHERLSSLSDRETPVMEVQNHQYHQKVERTRVDSNLSSLRQEPDTGLSGKVAIIGMSCQFPNAENSRSFWENLIKGTDCIQEIPEARWSWRDIYGDPVSEHNKTNIKWGGFIDGIDKFDPLFFGISPREAEFMDPQQRLLLTHAWQAIEDAGYSPSSLAGSNTAVFLGTTNSGYSDLLEQMNYTIDKHSATGSVASVGPNRISYLLDLNGPSQPVETACSSALVAIHRGIRELQSGRSDLAIVGGINTLITPAEHIKFSKAGMLAKDGRCKTFSDAANGYARGEGVGIFLLKPMEAALRDNDSIYGVIIGSAENHGGRSSSLTAPNVKAQASLLQDAYLKAKVDPRTISYIEVHGTGTELGDPIEINALKNAFASLYRKFPESGFESAKHCHIGSVKSNIGHLELAAGSAGLVKILLQMKHRQLVKSLHCENVNPYLQLQDGPFQIVTENKPWVDIVDKSGCIVPRRAGISSFGFGGVNAHLIIEEYIHPEPLSLAPDPSNISNHAIVLSAKDDMALRASAQRLLTYLIEQSGITDQDLPNLAYTLQQGRDVFRERLGFQVSSLKDLKRGLSDYLAGENPDFLIRGQAIKGKSLFSNLSDDPQFAAILAGWYQSGQHHKWLDLWVNGYSVNWANLVSTSSNNKTKLRRLHLPTYPFLQESYWPGGYGNKLHPDKEKIDKNLSSQNVNEANTTPHTDSESSVQIIEEEIYKILIGLRDGSMSVDDALLKTPIENL